MFTGIIRERGRIVELTPDDGGLVVMVGAPQTARTVEVGGSVAIAGVCLTAERVAPPDLAFRAVPETLSRSTLGALVVGQAVNLEPALRVGEPLGGHIVQGHVDGVGVLRAVAPEGDGKRITVNAPDDVLRYCVEKGSITIDGVSLTVASLDAHGFSVALIPHTLEVTTLAALAVGDRVNLEVDVLAKYVERALAR